MSRSLDFGLICFVALFFGVVCSSCSSVHCGANKTQYIEQYDRFIAEVVREDISLTDSKWSIYDEQFRLYMLDCYAKFQDDLTFADKQDILTKAVSYYYIRYGSHMIREIQNGDNPVSVMMMEEFRDIFDDPNQLLREIAGEDWEKMVDDFLDDLDKWRRRLQEMMEDEN